MKVGGAYRKLRSLREGPFVIQEVLGPLVYRLRLPRQWRIHDVFHASQLSPYRTTAVHGPAFAEPPPDIIEGEEEWEVEKILDSKIIKKGRKRCLEYFVKWKGYDEGSNSWEPEENLENSPEAVEEFYEDNPDATSLKRG